MWPGRDPKVVKGRLRWVCEEGGWFHGLCSLRVPRVPDETMADLRKAVIKNADMSEEMQQVRRAVACVPSLAASPCV